MWKTREKDQEREVKREVQIQWERTPEIYLDNMRGLDGNRERESKIVKEGEGERENKRQRERQRVREKRTRWRKSGHD